jgi:hypothetical protein
MQLVSVRRSLGIRWRGLLTDEGAGIPMKQLAVAVRKAGTVTGLGGTEMGIAVSEMFSVAIFYWQPLSQEKFKLVDLQRPTTKPRGLVHAEWIPVSMHRSSMRSFYH